MHSGALSQKQKWGRGGKDEKDDEEKAEEEGGLGERRESTGESECGVERGNERNK